jgi:TatD DNase family protein
VKLFDSHCHLQDEKFEDDREAAIERALGAGVERMMAIDAPEFAERYPFMYATVGVHPHEAANATEETFARIRDMACHPKVLAIGEIGLDYHYDFAPRNVQRAVFQRQLEIAAEFGKPIVIHTREAWEDTLAQVTALPHGGIMPGPLPNRKAPSPAWRETKPRTPTAALISSRNIRKCTVW